MGMRKIKKLFIVSFVFLLSASSSSLVWSAGSSSSSGSETGSSLVKKAQKMINLNRYSKAIPVLKKALVKSSKNADAHNLLGYSYRKLGKYDIAEVSYNKALAIKPKHKGALEYLGELYLETGRPDLARQLLARLKDVCPSGCEELEDLEEKIQALN